MNYFKYNDVDVVLLSQISNHYNIKLELLRSIYYRKRDILIEGEHYFVARGKDVKLFIREYSPNYYCSAKVSLWTKDGVDKLIEMGAQIVLCDPHRAVVMGLNRLAPLRGIRMSSPDIRAGVALLIAALSAEGKSVIENIDQIDRGYQNIDGRLNALGADIRRLA